MDERERKVLEEHREILARIEVHLNYIAKHLEAIDREMVTQNGMLRSHEIFISVLRSWGILLIVGLTTAISVAVKMVLDGLTGGRVP